jgi:hypothetical protein
MRPSGNGFTVIHSSVGAWLDIYLWEPGLLAIVVCQAIHHSLTAFYRQQAGTQVLQSPPPRRHTQCPCKVR